MKKASDNADFAALNEALLDFTDTLFFNFRFFEVSQKAFERVAGFFDICRATVTICKGNRRECEKVIYDSREFEDGCPFEEKSIHSVYGETNIYRIYRAMGSGSPDMKTRRLLEFLFKTTHTYLNRSIGIENSRYSRTHHVQLGCLNTAGFMEAAEELLAADKASSLHSIIFMNVKKFKAINGKVGFDNGNAVIRLIAEHLGRIADSGGLFAYMGGDNFIFLCSESRLESCIEEINSFSCTVKHQGRAHTIEASFRMGVFSFDSCDIKTAIENANIAFTFARQNRRDDIVCYTDEKREEYEHRKMLESSLRPAMLRGDITAYFQPKVDLEDGSLAGAEALTRWNSNGTIMNPGSFIPIFEQNGMICEMDFYIFEKVCAAMRSWLDKGLRAVTVSVNFSKLTLECPDFTEKVVSTAEKYNVPLSLLEIEFTETCCMENEKKFAELLCRLKNLGFGASLDDFGTGYSSINMLKNMNFDVLKLDRTFLTDEKLRNEREKIILSSVIKMAHNLNLEVVAEGVETPEQIEYLKRLKCRKAQGYHFGRPMPSEDFEKLLSRSSTEE